MKVEDFLLQLSKDPKFQKKMRAQYQATKKSGGTFGRKSTGNTIGYFALGIDVDEAKPIAMSIAQRIKEAIQTRLPSVPTDMFNIYGPYETDDGSMLFKVFFKAEAVHRESLYREGYPDGLANIVLLYSKGMKEPAKNPVWNRASLEWNYNRQSRTLYRKSRGKDGTTAYQYTPPKQEANYRAGGHYYIPAGWQRKPDSFLIDCIAAINAEMAKDGVTVTLNPVYYP